MAHRHDGDREVHSNVPITGIPQQHGRHTPKLGTVHTAWWWCRYNYVTIHYTSLIHTQGKNKAGISLSFLSAFPVLTEVQIHHSSLLIQIHKLEELTSNINTVTFLVHSKLFIVFTTQYSLLARFWNQASSHSQLFG